MLHVTELHDSFIPKEDLFDEDELTDESPHELDEYMLMGISSDISEDGFEANLFPRPCSLPLSPKPTASGQRLTSVFTAQAVQARDGLKEMAEELGQQVMESTFNPISLGPVAAPILSGAFALIQGAFAYRAEEILQRRLELTRRILQSSKPVVPLSEEALAEQFDPLQGESATTSTLQALHYAQQKMESRARRLKIKQAGAAIGVGSTIFGTITAPTAIGPVIAGGGALVASAVSLSPEVYGAGRAIYKHVNGTKGVTRKKASEFIWGLGLAHAISNGLLQREDLTSSPRATKALELIESDWSTLHRDEDLKQAQILASHFLQGVQVVSFDRVQDSSKKYALSMSDFGTKKGFHKIMSRFKSTAGA